MFSFLFFFFFNDTATTEIYTLSLHDALPNFGLPGVIIGSLLFGALIELLSRRFARRSDEHTSELQSQFHLVCRLLLAKKKKNYNNLIYVKKKRYRLNRFIIPRTY